MSNGWNCVCLRGTFASSQRIAKRLDHSSVTQEFISAPANRRLRIRSNGFVEGLDLPPSPVQVLPNATKFILEVRFDRRAIVIRADIA